MIKEQLLKSQEVEVSNDSLMVVLVLQGPGAFLQVRSPELGGVVDYMVND